MSSYVPIIKNGAAGAILYVSLAPRTATGQWQSNPTLATGDVKISLDGGALANLGTLPAVTPASSKLVKITLSQAETNADNIAIIFSDAAGAEWCDLTVNLQTAAKQFDDLATQSSVDAIQSDTNDIQTRLPAALVSGRMDSSIGAVASGVIAAASFASGALDAVWSTATRLLTAGTNIVLAKGTGVTGFNDLSAAQVNAEADAAIADAALATAANLETVAGYIDTEIGTIITNLATVDTVVDAILADTNELQTDWANGGRLDLILDARASQTSVDDLPTNAELATALAGADDAVLAQVALVKAKTDNLPSDPADQSLIIAATDAIIAGVDAIKAKTDDLTFTVAGQVDANVESVNEVEVIGTGASGDEWGPTP